MLPAILILAGGRSRRMGQDKALCAFPGGPTLLDRVAGRLHGQGAPVFLNAADTPAFARCGLTLIPDHEPGQPGPLAGILAGLEWMRDHRPDIGLLMTVPVDLPFVPRDLLFRLQAALHPQDGTPGGLMACAESGGRVHHAAALWPVTMAAGLRRALDSGVRRVRDWTDPHDPARVSFATTPVDPFLNVNHPEDLARAWRLSAHHPTV